MRSVTMGVAVLLFAGFAAAAPAQEAEARAASEQRRAQPRERAPRSQPDAAAPVREARGGERTRGTDDRGRVRAPRDYADSGGRGETRERPEHRAPAPPPTTFTRVEPRRQSAPERAEPARTAPEGSAPVASAFGSDDGQRRAVPRGSRPRGDNPAVGRAEPRDGRSYPREGRRDSGGWDGSRVYTSRGRVYNNHYYYYPRRWYPYGYGAFGGLGYFYYDPYTWYSYDPYWSRPYYSRYYGGSRYYADDDYYPTGELRLQVHPRFAEVYVDGYFAGNVDDFDGMFQSLTLEEGPHKIEIAAPGFDTLIVDVRILPGRKTTFRGELRPRP